MFGLGKKKLVADEQLYAPVTGDVIDLGQVSDPVFAQKMMGDGFAIVPENGEVVAPVTGKVTIASGHAIGLQRADGLEILLHLGIDTVQLNGAPFDIQVKVGDIVAGGDALVNVDWQQIKDADLDTTTMIIITNTAESLDQLVVTNDHYQAGQVVGSATAK
ncbi:PTS sugar transporter subunit IIA [Weissella soli]|uniref:PTS system IIA component (Glc family) n=1 Tax=Weissella soli TaxID=155866 RepID=A0A288QAM8_9LACO|nr:PTS glucose transporter subunit IIA [Weissella soli]AOT56182.1 Protein-N(pi)-phosphohistidine--sugar phosphotransferase [Weissella soli]MCT8394801.1 PTS glucose transporter subunit IIA [Weissella soli]NKY82641.1 PTS glucose transporter subunit IIA [Weissella soli]RDL11756.1 PTS system IIA component (Glc family) [Weissella soli]GEN93017.1 PTS sugar transporter subunit IIA [Weissella soli]